MRLIDADKLLENSFKNPISYNAFCNLVKRQMTVDAVPVARCKDCKHRPTGTDRDDLEFPDDKCPCKCEDYWYSWKPLDNWFCGNGERKDGEGNETD